jgi:N-acetyl-anhydromuramyl-L-alanine amidase AmpD
MSYAIDSTTWRSPNYGSRNGVPITTLVIHSCEGRLPAPRVTSLPWLCNPASRVSSHYYLCRDTSIFQLVDDAHEAWHAGGLQDDGTWTAQPAYSNPHSIGIECEHRSGQDWPSAQKATLAWLVQTLAARYHIAPPQIETHGQIAIAGPYKRKTDPTNWPHAGFVAWRDANVGMPTTKRYKVLGTPVWQQQQCTGPIALYLNPGAIVEVDRVYPEGTAHLSTGAGFIRLDQSVEAL